MDQSVASAAQLSIGRAFTLNNTSKVFDGSANITFSSQELGSVEYIVGTQSAKTGSWTGVTKDSELYAGKMIAYKLPYAGDGNASLNLTLADGTTTGAKAVYINTTRVTTHFPAESVVVYVYDGTYWRTFDYNTNTNDTSTGYYRYAHGTFKTYTALYRYQLLFSIDEEFVLPANTTSNHTAADKTTITTESFNPFLPIYYYNTTGTITAGSAVGVSNLWRGSSNINLAYSFNTSTSLTNNRDVYVVATMQDGRLAKLATDVDPITQILPSTEDNHIYILLGHACSTSNIILYTHHPIFVYRGGSIRLYSGGTDDAGDVISTKYVKKAGDTMTGNLAITFGDTDKHIMFDYDGDGSAGASWRIAALGTGSNDTNYLTIQSGTSTTSATTWNNVIRLGQNTFDAAFGGHVVPLSTNTKNLGSSSLMWANVYGTALKTANLTLSTNTISSDGSIIYKTASNGTHNFYINNNLKSLIDANGYFRPDTDNTLQIGTSDKKWNAMYATTFNGALNGNASSASQISATLATSTKAYLLGTSTTLAATAANVSMIGDTGVYLTTTAGELSALRYSIHDTSSTPVEKAYMIWNNTTEAIDFIFN